jgi:hypothetical protein
MFDKLKNMMRRRKLAIGSRPSLPGRRRRLLKRVAVAFAVLLVLFTVGGFFVVPPIAKYYAVKILSEQLDRQVSIREIEVNPFAMTAAVRGFAVKERDSSDTFVAFEELFVNLQARSIWERAPVLYEIRLTRPYVHVIRQPDGKTYQLADLLEKFAGKATPQEKASEPARFSLNNIQILEGRIQFHDRPKHATHDITDINIAIPFVSNLPYLAEQYVQPAFAAKVNGTPLALKGQTKPFKDSLETTLNVDIDRLPIARYLEYIPAKLGFRIPSGLLTSTGFTEEVAHSSTPSVNPLVSEGTLSIKGLRPANYASYYRDAVLLDVEDGQLALSTGYRFELPAQGEPKITTADFAATLNALKLRKRDAKDDFLKIGSISVKGLDADVAKRTLQLAELRTRDARLLAMRGKDGVVDLTQLVPAQTAGSGDAPAPTRAPSSPPWSFTVRRIVVDRYGVVFEDQMPVEPVVHTIAPINLKVDNLSNRADSKAKVALDLKVNQTGSLQASGQTGINPVGGQLDLLVQDLDLVPLQPYFQDRVNVVVGSGVIGTKGTLRFDVPAGGSPKLAFAGDLTVADFASVDKQNVEDLLKWNSLFVSGINAVTEPFSLEIREVALSDFYSRIIIYPDGRLNLQDIVARSGDAASDDVQQGAGAGENAKEPAKSPQAAQAADKPEPGTEQAAPVPPVTVGKVTLQGGDINFTDLFIKPNYSANLSELGGSVTGLSSQLDTTADVELRARFAKTAPVEIKGKVNPLVRNLFLDIKAGVRDIELGPFTPYSGKYVGYAIEKGKMTFNVEYKIENRRLAGKNQIVLNQLTFGEKIENPQATKLPVLLAVALLRDRNGVIDVNLPISGSLDDPKFSVGGIILRIIFNLIEKAVTAPFALIGSLVGGGGEELAYVEFDAGRAALTKEADEKLAKLKQALTDRPGLKLDITPRVDPEGDREGLRRYRFEQQVKAQKLKDLVKKGTSVGSVDEVTIEPSEYEAYLRKAYKAAKFPKPRNAIGLPKALPVEEMEKLMLTKTPVTDDDLVQLANARAQAAKDAITKGEQVAPERVFLLAPKPQAAKADEKLKRSRVDFSLK